jgi:hypothetical protein
MLRRTLIALSFLFALPAVANASPAWNAAHPRRAEVNRRLTRQNARIANGVATGRLTRGEAQRLHAADRNIRAQERAMAAANGGHITHREQRLLNREENRVSGRIYREKHR